MSNNSFAEVTMDQFEGLCRAELHRAGHVVVELGEGYLGARHVVAGTGVQVRPLLLLTAHTSKVDLGARFVEVDSLQDLPRPFHHHHLFLLLSLNIVQCTEYRHQDSGLILIVSLR